VVPGDASVLEAPQNKNSAFCFRSQVPVVSREKYTYPAMNIVWPFGMTAAEIEQIKRASGFFWMLAAAIADFGYVFWSA